MIIINLDLEELEGNTQKRLGETLLIFMGRKVLKPIYIGYEDRSTFCLPSC